MEERKFILKSEYQPTGDQPEAIESLVKSIQSGNRGQVLLGVTGSGKTEVYLRLIDGVIKEGKTAIMLVPEISLTPQTTKN